MQIKRIAVYAAFAAGIAALSGGVLASGGASGPAVAFKAQGNIGEVMVNPYKIAPLTAVIRNGGYVVKNATVTVLPKMGGQTIRNSVSDENEIGRAHV